MKKEREITTGTDAWNIAGGYVETKILRPLVLLDSYIRVAKFGSETIEESITLPPTVIDRLRIRALEYMMNELRIIIENTEFAIKKQEKSKLKPIIDKLKIAEEKLTKTFDTSIDTRTNNKGITIDEKKFSEALQKLREVKLEIATPLNNSGLIFPVSEEFDLQIIKDNLIQGG